jgi:epoxyqueuosine reductase
MKSKEIKAKAFQLGSLACGIIPSNVFHDYNQHINERISSFPKSKELYEPLRELVSPPLNARSIIVCIQRYNKYKIPCRLDGLIGKYYLFDSRIPYSNEYRAKSEFEEYLKILGMKIIECGIPDRLAAAKAGVGKFGRNNFLYSLEHGSYIKIDKWVIDIELDYDPVEDNIYLASCNDCRNCISSCPTKALNDSFLMDRGKCATQFLTYPKEPWHDNEKLDKETWLEAGTWVYGCDACQDACPLNKDKFIESEEFPLLEEFVEHLQPENIMEMDNETYINIINPRFWYAGEDGLWRWKCMALRSMINSGDSKYYNLIKKYREHDDSRIREAAQLY